MGAPVPRLVVRGEADHSTGSSGLLRDPCSLLWPIPSPTSWTLGTPDAQEAGCAPCSKVGGLARPLSPHLPRPGGQFSTKTREPVALKETDHIPRVNHGHLCPSLARAGSTSGDRRPLLPASVNETNGVKAPLVHLPPAWASFLSCRNQILPPTTSLWSLRRHAGASPAGQQHAGPAQLYSNRRNSSQGTQRPQKLGGAG